MERQLAIGTPERNRHSENDGDSAGATQLDPRIVRSRERIVHAATDLLRCGGLRAVTADAVAERSGVAKSTLYRHWPSVNELLLDVLRANVPASPTVDVNVGFEAGLRQWLHDAVVTLSAPDWRCILPMLLELRGTSIEMAQLLDADFDDKLEAVRTLLQLGASEGLVPDDLDPRMVAQMLAGPLVLSALMHHADDLCRLANFVVDRFLASYS